MGWTWPSVARRYWWSGGRMAKRRCVCRSEPHGHAGGMYFKYCLALRGHAGHAPADVARALPLPLRLLRSTGALHRRRYRREQLRVLMCVALPLRLTSRADRTDGMVACERLVAVPTLGQRLRRQVGSRVLRAAAGGPPHQLWLEQARLWPLTTRMAGAAQSLPGHLPGWCRTAWTARHAQRRGAAGRAPVGAPRHGHGGRGRTHPRGCTRPRRCRSRCWDGRAEERLDAVAAAGAPRGCVSRRSQAARPTPCRH